MWQHYDLQITFKEANLRRPSGNEGLDPLQVHLDGFCVLYLLRTTQLQNHLQHKVHLRVNTSDSTAPGNIIHSKDSAALEHLNL